MINTKRDIMAFGLLYMYEYAYSINPQSFHKNIKFTIFLRELETKLDFPTLVGVGRLEFSFTRIKNDILSTFDLTDEDYTSFKNSSFSIKTEIDSIINEFDNNAKHVSTIPGITGKGDLSQKAHYRALNPDLNKETALTFTFGKNKHGVDNFRKMDEKAAGEIWDALMRHLEAYRLGETHAEDSKLHHLAHACANLHMIYRLIKRNGDDKVLEVITGGDIHGLKRD